LLWCNGHRSIQLARIWEHRPVGYLRLLRDRTMISVNEQYNNRRHLILAEISA
jgi:hypothetical protein